MPVDPASLILLFNFVRESAVIGIEIKDLFDRAERGEVITEEELQLAEEAQLSANDELQGMD